MRIPVVMCGKCERQVDSLSWRQNFGTGAIAFEAKCHGEIDRCEVDFRKLYTPDAVFVSAKAFEPKKEVTHAA